MDWVIVSQIATAVGTAILAVATIVLALATINLTRGASEQSRVSREIAEENRALVRANREMVEEMRETRIAQDRPHVLVDVDYTYQPALDILIRNMGHGPAMNITFDSLPDLVDSKGKNLSELGFLRDGLDFLAPGAEVRAFWDMAHSLLPHLEQQGTGEGFTITAHYESVTGRTYESTWKFNPLLFKGRGYIRRYRMHDLAEAVRTISKDIHRVAGPGSGELRISTKAERRQDGKRVETTGEAEVQNTRDQSTRRLITPARVRNRLVSLRTSTRPSVPSSSHRWPVLVLDQGVHERHLNT